MTAQNADGKNLSVKIADVKQPVCFVLKPIADSAGYEIGHFGRVYEHVLKPAILAAGYEPVRADDTVKTDYIVVGIIQKIVDSAMVLCDFSARNPNVMYELGIRHAFNKPVVLVKDRKTEKIFDIQGLRYGEYDENLRVDTVGKDIAKITAAIIETAAGGAEGMNSIVQLAGIKTAEVPATQTISADTKLILNAVDMLHTRLQVLEQADERQPDLPPRKNLVLQRRAIEFLDGTTAERGETIFKDGEVFGELIDWNPRRDTVRIKLLDGSLKFVRLDLPEGQKLSSVPF